MIEDCQSLLVYCVFPLSHFLLYLVINREQTEIFHLSVILLLVSPLFMHHDDNFNGVKREIRFILVFLLMRFMYIDDVTATFHHFFCFSLFILSHHDVIVEGKKKQKGEIERDAYYIRPTRHFIYPFVCLSTHG